MDRAGLDTHSFTTFGDLLRHLRRRARLTQRELGIAVGYSETHITRLERHERRPDVSIVRARFPEALGVAHEPAWVRRLVELAQQATYETPATADATDVGGSAVTTSPQSLTNLPTPITHFVGRESDLTEIERLLAVQRLVTLVGAGGVGKTRLAIEIGMALNTTLTLPDGVWLVELAPHSDPALVPQHVALCFRLPEPATGHYEDMIVTHLREKRLLLILDNCEHLVDACAALAEAVLRGCPGVRILATSRESLRITGEVTWRVPPLQTPDADRTPSVDQALEAEAVQFFVQHAAATLPSFMLTPDNVATIAQICSRLDGIPLALELAASRLPGLSLQEMAHHLANRFWLLTDGSRTALPHHQTLRATLEWSHVLLSVPEQILLRRLSVFAGGWSADAAEAVCSDERLPRAEVLPGLLRLVQKSLITAEPQGEHTRYTMLETIRQFAAEKLNEAGDVEAEQVHDRHLDFYTDWRQSPEAGSGFASYEHRTEELENFRAAMNWGLTGPSTENEHALRLAYSLELVWQNLYLTEGRAWLTKLLARPMPPTRDRGMALKTAGLLALLQEDHPAGYGQLVESAQIARALGDQDALTDALNRQALVLHDWGRTPNPAGNYLAEARACLAEALQIARERGNAAGAANALLILALNRLLDGDINSARPLAQQGFRIFSGSEDGSSPRVHDLCNAHLGLALCDIAAQQWAAAHANLELSITYAHESRMRTHSSLVPIVLARVLREQGLYGPASRLLEERLTLNRVPGGGQSLGWLGVNETRLQIDLARVLQLQGNPVRATAVLCEWMNQQHNAQDAIGMMLARQYLASASLDQGALDSALAHFREGLRRARAIGSTFGSALALARIAEVAWRQGDLTRAAHLCGAAAALGDIRALARAFSLTCMPTDWQEYDRTMAAMRARLDDPTVAAAWAEGEHMTLPQAIDGVLRD